MNKPIKISGNTPSSKNSKMWTGKMLINSPVTMRYKKATEQQWIDNKEAFLEMIKDKELPYNIHFYFIRDSKRQFDYINAAQIVLDLMQKYEWLEDDSVYFVTPVFDGFEVNKEQAGVLIQVK